MDLVKSWLVALVVLVVTAVAAALTAIQMVGPDWLNTALGAATWSGGSAFIAYGLTALLAGLAHRTNRRGAKSRVLFAVFPVPALALLATLVTNVLRGGPVAVILAETLLAAAGMATGWAGVRALRGRGRRSPADAAYRY